MAVKRIVPNLASADPAADSAFFVEVLGLDRVMDMGWIVTLASGGQGAPQVSLLTEGGSGTPVPDLSIEVDDLDAVYQRAVAGGWTIAYGPVDEPWGVRRFYVRGPGDRLLNILAHN